MKKKNYILTAIVFICCFCINNMVAFAGTKFYWPVSTQWKMGTGYYGYTNHNGIDIPASKGTPVYALHDGKAVFYQAYKINSNGAAYLTSYGNYIWVTSHDGTYETLYAHLNAFEGYSLRIPSSQTKRESGNIDRYTIGTRDVKKGELIGYVGTTGNSSGNHLHFGLKVNGAYVNPETYLDASCCVKDVNTQTPSNTPQKDTEAPKILSVTISDITSDGYTVTITTTDNVGVSSVKTAVWTLLNDQDDIKWSEATPNGNTYTYHVKRSDHKNEFGYYASHVYVYDAQGNYSAMAANNINIQEEFVDVTSYFAGKEIQIKSVSNGKYLSADANYSGIPLLFNCDRTPSTWETFSTTLTSDKWLGLKSYTNQKWVSAMHNITDSPLQASTATSLQSWECFRIFKGKDGHFYIKSQNEKWLCARLDKTSTPVEACCANKNPSTWEQLQIFVKINGKFVSAANVITK